PDDRSMQRNLEFGDAETEMREQLRGLAGTP
ncbi:MAG: hypothetical protein QOF73_4361, partial [Thermomicrobiales bacterium]|nr:hypothetical protein [Thermomicrobiales bacterium]